MESFRASIPRWIIVIPIYLHVVIADGVGSSVLPRRFRKIRPQKCNVPTYALETVKTTEEYDVLDTGRWTEKTSLGRAGRRRMCFGRYCPGISVSSGKNTENLTEYTILVMRQTLRKPDVTTDA